METYYTLEEKYIQAVEEMRFGETAKALKILNELLEVEPKYARTYFQLGKIYYYDIQDYQSAGYYFERCTELEPDFPEAYPHYLKLLVFLGKEKQARKVAELALLVPGISACGIYEQLGLLNEMLRSWTEALSNYSKGILYALNKEELDNLEDAVKRTRFKMEKTLKYSYQVL